MKIFVSLLLVLVPLSSNAFDHSALAQVLTRYVDQRGFVAYQALEKDRVQLDQYAAQISKSGPTSTPGLFPSREDQLAFYLNAYNALVIKGVIDRGETKTIWGFFGSGYGFFSGMKISLDGETLNLQTLEDELIRAAFGDPRIHAAINCASVSCPRLRNVPFSGDGLDTQLDDAFREFVNNPLNVRVEAGVIYLSSIFNWFEQDFTAHVAGEGGVNAVIQYVNRYRQEGQALPGDLPVKYLAYNKNLNAQ